MTHDELIVIAVKWLCKKYPIVITEMASVGEEPDAIAFNSGLSVLIECKASRSDFVADRKKFVRQNPQFGLGKLRYYMCPKGLISTEELPTNWGLIYVNDKNKTRVVVKARQQPCTVLHERCLLISLIRRIGQKPIEGVSIRCYTHETKNRTTTSIEPQEVLERALPV